MEITPRDPGTYTRRVRAELWGERQPGRRSDAQTRSTPKRPCGSHPRGVLVEIAVEHSDGRIACERCFVADTPLTRLRGLLGRRPLAEGQGLLLRPAAAIHTWFMRGPIDAVFLDRELMVVGVAPNIRPWRFAARRGSRAVLELAAGESARRAIAPGSCLRVRPTNGSAGAR